MHLAKNSLKKLIQDKQIVTGYADLDGQLTANGVDLRLAALIEIEHAGRLAINKKDNKPPRLGKAFVLDGYQERIKDEVSQRNIAMPGQAFVPIKALRPYFAITCEEVNIPNDMMIDIAARSSLFRLTQSGLMCTFGEAGYQGYLTFMLLPYLDAEIELGARFSQITFAQLTDQASYTEQKQSNYQGGKLY